MARGRVPRPHPGRAGRCQRGHAHAGPSKIFMENLSTNLFRIKESQGITDFSEIWEKLSCDYALLIFISHFSYASGFFTLWTRGQGPDPVPAFEAEREHGRGRVSPVSAAVGPSGTSGSGMNTMSHEAFHAAAYAAVCKPSGLRYMCTKVRARESHSPACDSYSVPK